MNLDDAAMNALVVKAMLDAIPQAKRDELVANALAGMLRGKKATSYPYEQEPSVIEQAFRSAAYEQGQTLVRERLRTDPDFRAAVDAILGKAIKRLLEAEAQEKLAAALVFALVQAFKSAS